MDPSSVLLALEEQRKWRERRQRIEEHLKQIARRRAFLHRELEYVRKKIADYAEIVMRPRTPPVAIEFAVPIHSLLR